MNDAVTGNDDQMAQLSVALSMINMENQKRARIDFENAKMLGYDSFDSEGLVGTDLGNIISRTVLGRDQRDQVVEIESSRYFVVLMAYDFQLMWKEKKHKLLWETRFSINQPRNNFGKALPAMAQYASQYFGQNSNGLIRKPIREGTVEIGAPTLVEEVPEPKK
jgi:hypothetical protein